jgi:hypothetical protein
MFPRGREQDVCVTIQCVPPEDAVRASFSGRKASNSMSKISTFGVLRLRAIRLGSCGRSVRRSAQDDDFVGVLRKNNLNKLALIGLRLGRFRPEYATRTWGTRPDTSDLGWGWKRLLG